jgi:hypothetical protein
MQNIVWMVKMNPYLDIGWSKRIQHNFHVRNRQISTQVCLPMSPRLELHTHVPQTHELLKLQTDKAYSFVYVNLL